MRVRNTSLAMPLAVIGAAAIILGQLAAALAGETAEDFNHGEWPFQSPQRPPVPSTDHPDWAANPIDAFVLERLETAGISPNRRAEKLALLRRVTFDLTGLPPTQAEQQAFAADDAPDAYLKVVDRLLTSDGFGERWAQHWLDVVRYAETEGFKADSLRKDAHKYRDYVIRSLSADRPYDEFVRQQLAGDELEIDNPEALIATGFNRLYPDENNAANLFQRRQEILDNLTETTGLVFVGLTMGCAQCHDHKFDEILQTDYYQLQAFFTPLIERDDVTLATPDAKAEYKRQYQAWDEATREIRDEMESLLADRREKLRRYRLGKFRESIQQCVLTPEGNRTPLQQQIALMALRQLDAGSDSQTVLKKLPKPAQQQYGALAKRLAEFDHLRPAPLPTAMAVSDLGTKPPPTYRLSVGNWQKPQEEVKPGFPSFLSSVAPDLSLDSTIAGSSTGRRAALARWLTQAGHPLTSRVIVNRLWQHHFGRGIVATPNDFGVQGQPPTHPELLDWLAVELVEHGWSLKHIHRLMVTSATYCQSSRIDATSAAHEKALAVDGQNDLFWRANRRRMEGEAIRDAMLQIADRLSVRKYGPSARPTLPAGISKRYGWQPDPKLEQRNRRSIYVFAKRNLRFPLFDAFDLPDLHNSCGQRTVTTTAPQALLMLNSQLTIGLAERWAERLLARFGGDYAALVTDAYRGALGRPARPEEIDAAVQFLVAQTPAEAQVVGTGSDESSVGGQVSTSAVVDFCHALFNCNEFLYVD